MLFPSRLSASCSQSPFWARWFWPCPTSGRGEGRCERIECEARTFLSASFSSRCCQGLADKNVRAPEDVTGVRVLNPLQAYLAVSAILFAIGFGGVVTRRNAIVVL